MLFFSIHLPTDKVPQAGHKICYNHLCKLAQEHEIHLVSQVNTTEKRYLEQDFEFCKTANFIEINNWRRISNLVSNPWLPFRVAIRANQRIKETVQKLVSTNKISEIFIEYEQGAYLLPLLKTHVKNTVVFHDILSQQIARKLNATRKTSPLRLLLHLELRMTKRWERSIVSFIDKAVVFSEKDRALLVDLGMNPAKVVLEPPAVDPVYFTVRRENPDPRTIIFWGALDRAENEDGILWFLDRIFPEIVRAIPEARIIVLGANPSSRLLRYASSNVLIPGYVRDPIPYFEKAALAVAPLRLGAGVKIKVLEFMAAKIFTVSTSVAAEGIPHTSEQIAIADDASSFAQLAIRHLTQFQGPLRASE